MAGSAGRIYSPRPLHAPATPVGIAAAAAIPVPIPNSILISHSCVEHILEDVISFHNTWTFIPLLYYLRYTTLPRVYFVAFNSSLLSPSIDAPHPRGFFLSSFYYPPAPGVQKKKNNGDTGDGGVDRIWWFFHWGGGGGARKE